MNVQKLLNVANFEEVWPEIRDVYYTSEEDTTKYIVDFKEISFEEIEKLKNAYYNFFGMLKSLPINSPDSDKEKILTIIKYTDEWSVSLYTKDELYSLSFIPWEEIMGYSVCEHSLKKYTINQCVAHILWELSFYGFEKENIEKEKNKLETAINECNLCDQSKFKTIEELFKELGYEDNRTEEEKKEEQEELKKQIEENNIIRMEFLNILKQEISDFQSTLDL